MIGKTDDNEQELASMKRV